jgi:UDP-3-O-[3-hydroxymyristoyl] N-acetylglucosamine deacetylase
MHQTDQSVTAAATSGCSQGDSAPAQAQRTLRHAISCVGISRHSGVRVGLTLQPAESGTGIRFRRTDRPGAATVGARPEHLVVADHALILADADGTRIVGIELVTAALAMTGIDNAVIEVGGPELPAMDGSAQPFVFLIECAGAIEQDAPRAACSIPAPVDLRRGEAMARLAPSVAPHLATDIGGLAISRTGGPRQHVVALQRDALRHELAAARQALTAEELEAARERGLMRGVSLENTLIIDGARAANAGGLRFPDEPARHANLLALASLALLGGLPPVELLTRAAGHSLLARLLRHCGREPNAIAPVRAVPAGTAGVPVIGHRAGGPA